MNRVFIRVSVSAALLFVASVGGLELISAETTIDILGVPTQISIKDDKGNNFFYIRANSDRLSSVECHLIPILTSDHGSPAPLRSLKCEVPKEIDMNQTVRVELTPTRDPALFAGTYNAALQIFALDSKRNPLLKTISFKIISPAVALKIGETSELRIQMHRKWNALYATGSLPIGLRVTSDLQPTETPIQISPELYVPDGSGKNLEPGGKLGVEFHDPGVPTQFSEDQCEKGPITNGAANLGSAVLCLQARVPPGVKEATGMLRLHSAEFASDNEVPVTLFIKDSWIWAAFDVLLAQFLSWAVSNYLSNGRQRRLNKMGIDPIRRGLGNFLVKSPGLVGDQDATAINELLDDAQRANRLGDIATASTKIEAAKGALEGFKEKSPPNLPNPAPEPQLLLVEDGYAYVWNNLHLVILNPKASWTSNAEYSWEILPLRSSLFTSALSAIGLKPRRTVANGPSRGSISWRPEAKGSYTVKVTVNPGDGAQSWTTSQDFTIEFDKTKARLRNITWWDGSIALLAVVFGATLAFLAIDKLDSFGTVSDYALTFLAAFGLSSTTSGFGGVLSRSRAGATSANP